MLTIRKRTERAAVLCLTSVALAACASSGGTTDIGAVLPDAASAAAAFEYEPMAAATTLKEERRESGLTAAISSTIASAGAYATTRPVSSGIAFGAPFDCKPGHAPSGGAETAAAKSDAAPAAATGAGHSASDLAKKSQNPVANMISLPIEYNANFDNGYRRNTQTIVNVKPVIPMEVNADWNWIHRVIIPLIDQPNPVRDSYSRSGLGDITYQGFLSPKKPTEGGLIWGVGPTLGLPTATDDILGSDQWTAGPSVVGLHIGEHWVLGGVASNVWTFAANDSDRPNLRFFSFQPIVNYNFGGGWYATSSPVVTAKWSADSAGDVWTVPMGVGVGKIFHIGSQAIDLSLRPFYNVHRPENGTRWSMQIVLKFLFPQE